jgi:two-component sensor histidine kinase/two-component SAPR family response regulator
MIAQEKVNILLVDDQPRKLLSYEVVLRDLQENLIKVSSAREALEQLLKSEIAVILIDVCMPDLDGFQLASMIREHPRFQQTAIIFVSAIHLNEVDFRRGYEMGAVDYVPVPVVPEVLRAKVKIFVELFRKTRALEKLNAELETRVSERTAELEASTVRLLQSEQRRDLALAAGNMGSWDWDLVNGDCMWDGGQYRIFGVDSSTFSITLESVRALIHLEDWARLQNALTTVSGGEQAYQTEFRVRRPDGEWRWCMGTASATVDPRGRITRLSGVTVDITDRKHTEERQNLLAREADHRAKNALAVVQSIVRLTKADAVKDYVVAVEGRIGALARAHTLLAQSRWQGAELATLVDEELAPYRTGDADRIIFGGPEVLLKPRTAQTIAVAVHELATNAAKHGALASLTGRLALGWELSGGALVMRWSETGEPLRTPSVQGFGIKVIISSVEAQLGGKARFDWRRDGMDCTLIIPHLDQGGPEARVPWQQRREAPSGVDKPADAQRVMIVEDEVLIGMMMKDALTGLGLAVVGPFVTVDDAMRALEEDPVDFAILDVNLGGEWVYPVADRLATRGIPFVFVTGYGGEGLDGRFAQTPVFEKPIEPHVLETMFGRAHARGPAGDATRWTPTSCAS